MADARPAGGQEPRGQADPGASRPVREPPDPAVLRAVPARRPRSRARGGGAHAGAEGPARQDAGRAGGRGLREPRARADLALRRTGQGAALGVRSGPGQPRRDAARPAPQKVSTGGTGPTLRRSVWRADEGEGPNYRPGRVPRRGSDPREAQAAVAAERGRERVGAIKAGERRVLVERLSPTPPQPVREEAPRRRYAKAGSAPAQGGGFRDSGRDDARPFRTRDGGDERAPRGRAFGQGDGAGLQRGERTGGPRREAGAAPRDRAGDRNEGGARFQDRSEDRSKDRRGGRDEGGFAGRPPRGRAEGGEGFRDVAAVRPPGTPVGIAPAAGRPVARGRRAGLAASRRAASPAVPARGASRERPSPAASRRAVRGTAASRATGPVADPAEGRAAVPAVADRRAAASRAALVPRVAASKGAAASRVAAPPAAAGVRRAAADRRSRR